MSITLIISIFFLVIAIWLFNFHETKIINLLLVKPYNKIYSNISDIQDNVNIGNCIRVGEVEYKSSHSYHTTVERNTIKFFGKATLPKKSHFG